MAGSVLRHYETNSEALIDKYEAINPTELYAPVAMYLPQQPARILDVGAGTGRDAAWLCAMGHHVTAVEPVAGFRAAGQRRHGACDIRWVSDTLPQLSKITSPSGGFECILLTAVWHHLQDLHHDAAMHRLGNLLASEGRLIVSIRHSGALGLQEEAATAKQAAARCGLTLSFETQAPSVQRDNHEAGVSWTWVVFERGRYPPVLAAGLTPQGDPLR